MADCNPSEDAVQHSVENAFSADFVYRSPRRASDGKEVTDVLVLFDDVAIVIQVKAKGISNRDSLDWARKNLNHAFRQTNGAIRAVGTSRLETVINDRRGSVAFDSDRFPYRYGLIVLDHDSSPYDPHELCPDLGNAAAPIHVLSLADFKTLTSLLDTPADLVNYFEHRTDVLVPSCRPLVHEESAAFRYYVENFEDVYETRANARGDELDVHEIRRAANCLRGIVQGAVDRRPGLLIDRLIDRLHADDPTLDPITLGNATIPNAGDMYIEIAERLGYIPRARRIALGARAQHLANRARQTHATHQMLTTSAKRSECLLYLVSPLPREQRDQRRRQLAELTCIAKAYCGVTTAMGIVTTSPHLLGGAEDFVLVESPAEAPSKDVLTHGENLFGPLNDSLVS